MKSSRNSAPAKWHGVEPGQVWRERGRACRTVEIVMVEPRELGAWVCFRDASNPERAWVKRVANFLGAFDLLPGRKTA